MKRQPTSIFDIVELEGERYIGGPRETGGSTYGRIIPASVINKSNSPDLPKIVIGSTFSSKPEDLGEGEGYDYNLIDLVREAKASKTGWILFPHVKCSLEAERTNRSEETSTFKLFGEKQGMDGIYDLVISKRGIQVLDASGYSKPLSPETKESVTESFIRYVKTSDEGPKAIRKLTVSQLNELNSQIARYLKNLKTKFNFSKTQVG